MTVTQGGRANPRLVEGIDTSGSEHGINSCEMVSVVVGDIQP